MRTKTPRRPPSGLWDRPDDPPTADGTPSRLDRAAFTRLVEESIDSLPQNFRKLLENVAVLVEDFPSPETMRDMGLRSPYQLFGLYHGIPLDKRGSYYGNVPPDVVVIYQRPIESACATEAEIREQVRDTVIHEVGHFFGFGEAELRDVERENRKKRSRS
ncbi:MAG: metallopeptidase family protein [Candidatus Aminicenantes bacterium]|nr:metallopeptidase family protein [Candidatus Aminicenantes bacterium]